MINYVIPVSIKNLIVYVISFAGVVHYIRTCSTNIDIRMSIALVCMSESRPGDGHLCMCRKPRCNGSNSIHSPSKTTTSWPLFLSLLLSLIFAQSYLPEFSSHTCDATLWTVLTTVSLMSGAVFSNCKTLQQHLNGVIAHLYTRRHHPPIG